MKDAVTTENELLIPEVNFVAKAYEDDEKITAIIEAIEKDVKAEVYTVETAVGRKRIASQAYKISRSKTAMDKVGADLIEEANKLVKTINGRRNIVKTRLDTLRDDIRKPLTEWEDKDNARKEALVERIDACFGLRPFPTNSADLRALQDATIAIELDESWQEYLEEATKAKDNFLRLLSGKITDAVRIEEREALLEKERQEQAAELTRLREAEAQRKRDDEARAAAEAEASKAKALADAEIARLKEELDAMRQRPMPAPVGIVGIEVTHVIPDEVTADQVEVTAVDMTFAAVEKIDMPAKGDNFVRLGSGTFERQIAAQILALIEDCEDHHSAADTIAAAIVNGEISNVRVI